MSNLQTVPGILEQCLGEYPLRRRCASGVFPIYEALSAKDSYKAAKFGGSVLAPEDFKRPMGGEARRYTEIPHDTVDIPVERYSIESSADWSEASKEDMKHSLLLLESRAKFALEKLLNSIEAEQVALALNGDMYPEGHVIRPAKGGLWDEEESDPIAQIEAAKELIRSKIGITPNQLTISEAVWRRLRVRKTLLTKLPSTVLKAGLTPEAFAEIAGVARVTIADTAQKKNGVMVSAWGKNAHLCYNPQAVSDPQNEPMFGVTLLRPLGYEDMRYYSDEARSSEVFAADRYLGWGIVNPEAGVLFASVVS